MGLKAEYLLLFYSKDHPGCHIEFGWVRKQDQEEVEAVSQERVVPSGDGGDREDSPLWTGVRGTLGLPV